MKTWPAILCLTLAACGSADDRSSEPEDAGSAFDPMVESLDKAKALDDAALRQKEQMDEALKRLEGDEGEAQG